MDATKAAAGHQQSLPLTDATFVADQALVDSLKSDSIDVLATAADVGVDAFLTSGALDGVPIVNLLAGAAKASKHIPAFLFQRKVARFLVGASQADLADRTAFVGSLSNQEDYRRFGETVLLLLDRVDEIAKAEMIGRCMAGCFSGKIERADAHRLATKINRVSVEELSFLKSFRSGTAAPHQTIAATLHASGWLDWEGTDYGLDGGPDDGGDSYTINADACLFLRLVFGVDIDPVVRQPDR